MRPRVLFQISYSIIITVGCPALTYSSRQTTPEEVSAFPGEMEPVELSCPKNLQSTGPRTKWVTLRRC